MYCKAEPQQQQGLIKMCFGCQVMVQLHLMPDPKQAAAVEQETLSLCLLCSCYVWLV